MLRRLLLRRLPNRRRVEKHELLRHRVTSLADIVLMGDFLARNWIAMVVSVLAIVIGGLLLVPYSTPSNSSLSTEAGEAQKLLPVGADGQRLVDRPDVIVIVTDDQPVGYEDYMTKTQKLFSKEGVVFTNAHSLTSTCCPSRASLFTGKESPATGVWSNWAPVGGWEVFLDGRWEGRTLATALDRRGYRTALVGKYLNGYDSEQSRIALTGDPTYVPPGWDVWVAKVHGKGTRGSYYNYGIIEKNEQMFSPTVRYFGAAPADYSTDVLGKKVIDTIKDTPQGTPLFLMWTPNAPHAPYAPPPTRRQVSPVPKPPTSLNKGEGKPPWIADRKPITMKKSVSLQQAQIRTLQSVDDWVSRIAQTLKAEGRWDNTIFIFTSDNGYFRGEYGLIGIKNHPHPASTRVPLMVVSPSLKTAAAKQDRRLATLADIPATIAAAAGINDAAMDGLPLDSALSTWREGALIAGWRNRGSDPAGNQPAYCAWRNSHWLFIQYSANREGAGYREMYDIKEDPDALYNIAGTPSLSDMEDDLARLTRAECSPAPPEFVWPSKILIPIMAPTSR